MITGSSLYSIVSGIEFGHDFSGIISYSVTKKNRTNFRGQNYRLLIGIFWLSVSAGSAK